MAADDDYYSDLFDFPYQPRSNGVAKAYKSSKQPPHTAQSVNKGITKISQSSNIPLFCKKLL